MADLHDHFFKAVFGRPDLAVDLLRVMGLGGLVDALDVSTLTPAPTETVDAALANKRADLVYEARTPTGGPVVIQLEHQSVPDRDMALRLLFYAARALQRWDQQEQREKHMPLVASRVLYNGTTPWTPRPLTHAINPSLRRFHKEGPSYPVRVTDVADIRRSRSLTGMARLAIDALYVGTRPHLPLVQTLAPSIRALADSPSKSGDLHVIEAFLRYVYSVRPHANDQLPNQLLSLFPDPYDNMAQTTLEWLNERARQEGIEIGVEIGRQEGVELGRQEGVELGRQEGVELGAERARRETARRLGMASVPLALISKVTGLSEEEVRELIEHG